MLLILGWPIKNPLNIWCKIIQDQLVVLDDFGWSWIMFHQICNGFRWFWMIFRWLVLPNGPMVTGDRCSRPFPHRPAGESPWQPAPPPPRSDSQSLGRLGLRSPEEFFLGIKYIHMYITHTNVYAYIYIYMYRWMGFMVSTWFNLNTKWGVTHIETWC